MKKEKFYHASQQTVLKPDLKYSREDVDFGAGFYLTKNYSKAQKWASAKKNSVVSEYILDLSKLKVYHFKLDEEWLVFVMDNRMLKNNHLYDDYDVLIGPTADDQMYDTLQDYYDGYLSGAQTVKYLSVVEINEQIVLKNEKAIGQLHFVKSYEISNDEKLKIRSNAIRERKQIIKEVERKKKEDQ